MSWENRGRAAESKVEALMYSLRLGTNELAQPATKRRLSELNEEQLRASTQKLLDLVEREHVTLVIFGHDGQQWQTLKKAPAFYE